MNINELEQLIHQDVTKRFQEYNNSVPPEPQPEPDVIVLKAGDDLQAALDKGGNFQLEKTADFGKTGGFLLKVANTYLQGLENNTILGSGAPAIRCGLGYQGGKFDAIKFKVTEYDQSMLRFGINGTEQDTVIKTPRDFRFTRISIPEFRGKRAFEINAADVVFENCDVHDIYAPAGVDSQAIWFFNTPGNLHIKNCYLEAASENFMCGGDRIKLTDARPTNLLIEDSEFSKPLAWQTAGAPKVKNLFELKDGWDVVIKNCTFTNCWKSAQDGYGFTFTPSQGGRVKVRVENCTMSNVSAICNITGQDQGGYWPNEPRTQVHIIGGSYNTNKANNGGTGRFALITHGPESVIVEGATITHDGSSFIAIGDSKIIDKLHVLNCTWNYGSYGIFINGAVNGDNSAGVIKDFKVEGCTIRGASSAFKTRFPNNTYVSLMTRSQEETITRRRIDEEDLASELKRRAEWEKEYQF